MEIKQHQKHSNLLRRKQEFYANNEIAILGSNCSIIGDFVSKMAKKLQKKAKIAYFDASHSEGLIAPIIDTFTMHKSGALKFEGEGKVNKASAGVRFAEYDLLFVNGNHYQGAKQILILDVDKEVSVKKRLKQLDGLQFVIKKDKNSVFFDFLVKAYPNIKNLKCYDINDTEAISGHIGNLIEQEIAPVQGLVLAGGKSTRMGADKTRLMYYDKPQVEHVVDLMEANKLQTYVSVAVDGQLKGYNIIQDKFVGLGVFGAICSAFQKDPNKAWLVLATDLPNVNSDLINLLLSSRNPTKIATAVKGSSKEFVEPLVTIYEPKAYPVLLAYLAQGYSCPRKVLINSDVEIIEIDDQLIKNINTPQEYKEVKEQIKN